MAKKNALGRGLGALIESNSSEEQELAAPVSAIDKTIAEIAVEDIISVNPFQPRSYFDEEKLEELAGSIAEIGMIQPVTVRLTEQGKYQLIAGERRLRAAKKAGLQRLPAYVRMADDQALLEMALVENIQREDLDAIEVAISYQRLIEECNLTQENLSSRVGKKRATVTNYLRLLKLPAEIQIGIREKKLSMGHARALLSVEDNDIQLQAYQKVLDEELSVRKTEELIRNLNNPPVKDVPVSLPTPAPLSQEYEELKNHLSKHFSTGIEFKRNDNGSGKIIISFKTDEELERIIALLDK
ncbi:MAG: ParB/RepB/Spo0J family partition protein [Bacteroidales bacterium]|nr:ParB/RepB/Spo0J family partition protein [Bacteroidales bacterium]